MKTNQESKGRAPIPHPVKSGVLCEGEEGLALYFELADRGTLPLREVHEKLKEPYPIAPMCWTASAIANDYATIHGDVFAATDKLKEELGRLESLIE